MRRGDEDYSPPALPRAGGGVTIEPAHDIYNPSIASSASSSSISIWSDAASQTSDDALSSISGHLSSDTDTPEAYRCRPPIAPRLLLEPVRSWPRSTTQLATTATTTTTVPPSGRRHPRRTSSAKTCPPTLVRQSDRKVHFVDNLVDISAAIVEAIWPLSSVPGRVETGAGKGVLPLRTFIQETLKRSRTSYYTLQVALYYLVLIKNHVPKHDFTMEQPRDAPAVRALQCGRRMFLAALILASKYLQDRNFSARAWSKISGLNTAEINQNEMVFLLAVNWHLHISDLVFQRWTEIVLAYTPPPPLSPTASTTASSRTEHVAAWKRLVLRLTPELDDAEILSSLQSRVKPSPVVLDPWSTPCPAGTPDHAKPSIDAAPTPRAFTPAILEPWPMSSYPTTKPAPALGLLPTPRLTPQLNMGFGTPAVGPAASSLLGSKASMSYALAQTAPLVQHKYERWPASPVAVSLRGSALAHSVTSSPESMISDHSSTSTVSTAPTEVSSHVAALPSSSYLIPSTKLDILARCRSAHAAGLECGSLSDAGLDFTSSPEAYASTPTPTTCSTRPPTQRIGSKRGRAGSFGSSSSGDELSSSAVGVQEQVRGLLWTDSPMKRESSGSGSGSDSSRKRFKGSASATPPCKTQERGVVGLGLRVHGSRHPSFGGSGGPGMWDGILH